MFVKKFFKVLWLVLLMYATSAANASICDMLDPPPQLDEEKFKTLQKEAEQKRSRAISDLAYRYLLGVNVEQDSKKSIELYKSNGERDLCMLVMIYYYGAPGIDVNFKQAFEYAKRDFENHARPTATLLGLMYYNGQGTKKDIIKGIEVWQKGKEAGDKLCAKTLSDVLFKNCYPVSLLIDENRNNQMRFNSRFLGKDIKIAGYFGKIKEREDYTIHVDVYPDKDGFLMRSVECVFNSGAKDKLMSFNKGEIILVSGKYNGNKTFQLGDILLSNCQIIESN